MSERDMGGYFDFFEFTERTKDFLQKLIDDKLELQPDVWLQDKSVDFYKGMYAAGRVALSLQGLSPERQDEILLRMNIDLLLLINKKSQI